MSTLKVNNIEPTSGNTIIINADTQIVSSTGNVIDLGGATNDFSGSLTVTGSISNKDGDVIINDGNLIIKSGSLEITGSGETLTIIGNSDFQGDIIISGCLDIACYNDNENPVFWAVDGRITDDVSSGFLITSINYNTYGDLTSGIAAAAAASNNIAYIYDTTTGTYAPYGYVGTNFDGVATFISSSGPAIAAGTVVQIGFSTPISGATPIYPIGTGSATPVASFCCDGITLYSDVTISGGLDVYGPTNLHDGLIVTGCIEMYCPGDENTSFYGYEGNVRFSKESGSGVYATYTYLNASYGNVTSSLSASAAANGGTFQLYNTVTGASSTVTYVGAQWTGTFVIVTYTTNTLTTFNPPTTVHIGNPSPPTLVGADVLMGTGSQTPVQTAVFCCDGNTLYGDTTFTGSVTITGSTAVTGSTTVTGTTEVTGSVNIKGDGKVDGNFVVSGSIQTSGSFILPVLDGIPETPGTKGQIVFVVDSGNYYIYGYLNDAWRSGSLF